MLVMRRYLMATRKGKDMLGIMIPDRKLASHAWNENGA